MKTFWKVVTDGNMYHKIEIADNKFFIDTMIDPNDPYVAVKVNMVDLETCKKAYSSKAYTEISKDIWNQSVETLKSNLSI